MSNFNDSGYTIPSNWRNAANQIITQPNSSSDIYGTSQQCGVYMFNGLRGSSGGTIYPVFSSTSNLNFAGMPNLSDDGWLILPGFGFILYTGTNYGGVSSRAYINTSTIPEFYHIPNLGWSGYGTAIKQANGTDYPKNDTGATSSIKIFFRGSEVVVAGLNL